MLAGASSVAAAAGARPSPHAQILKALTHTNPQHNHTLTQPVHVFGDIHGNFSDLKYFESLLWPLGVSFSAGSFLWLGDYVDRGAAAVETILCVLLCPHAAGAAKQPIFCVANRFEAADFLRAELLARAQVHAVPESAAPRQVAAAQGQPRDA